MLKHLEHKFDPVWDKNSKVLILGTFPSLKSREDNFYYSHPQNRFWKLISVITNTKPLPVNIEQKKDMLIKNGIALWDVVKICDLEGFSDSSIKNVTPMDLSLILDGSNIKKLYANGSKAYELYIKHCLKNAGRDIIKLPSTSPANANYNFKRLLLQWKQII